MLLAVSKATKRDDANIPRIASGLGGGIGRQGEACGALTGGALALGLVYGRDRAEEKGAKKAVHAKAGQFARRFEAVNGAIRCRDLTGLDTSEGDWVRAYYARDLKAAVCHGVVEQAVRALLELMNAW